MNNYKKNYLIIQEISIQKINNLIKLILVKLNNE